MYFRLNVTFCTLLTSAVMRGYFIWVCFKFNHTIGHVGNIINKRHLLHFPFYTVKRKVKVTYMLYSLNITNLPTNVLQMSTI